MSQPDASFPLAHAEPRDYQTRIARACQGRNSLVILPTGLGKTIVAALLAAHHLDHDERVLVVAPTQALVQQHADVYQDQLPHADVATLTGNTPPQERTDAWTRGDILVATPQTARNDLTQGTLDPRDWGLLIVDEAHRATGKHASTEVAAAFRKHGTPLLGTTASPAEDPDAMQTVIDNLAIHHIEARTERDPDVAPYVDPVTIDWIRINLPETLQEASSELRTLAESYVDELRSMDLYRSRFVKRGDLLTLRKRLQNEQAPDDARTHVTAALRALHAIELVETQSTTAARAYLDTLASSRLAEHPSFQHAKRRLESYLGEHPKMRRCARSLEEELRQDEDARGLVFVKTRETGRALLETLEDETRLRCQVFFGRSGEDGLTPDQQRERLDALRDGDVDVLVATSVGEEGLDVPSVDLVVFYEPVASAVRAVQRKGRTGRDGPGHVLVLVTRGTRDEAAYWSAAKRERRMRRLVRQLQSTSKKAPEPSVRSNPSAYEEATCSDSDPTVLVDHKHANGPLARRLRREGISIEPARVPHGDAVLSSRTVVHHTTVPEAEKALQDETLPRQIRILKRGFPSPVLILEGDPFADAAQSGLLGELTELASRWGVPMIQAHDPRQTASLIAQLARRENQQAGAPTSRDGTGGRSLAHNQRFLLQALPNVSQRLSDRLLEAFGTPGNVLGASEDELASVPGIGPNTATAIRRVLHADPETPWRNGTSTSTPAPGTTTRSGTGPKRSASSRSRATTP